MNKEELIELLDAIAEKESVDLVSVVNHPCNIAKRALNQCFEDIESLQAYIFEYGRPEMEDRLRLHPYNPEW